MKFLVKHADVRERDSLATRLRQKRFELFNSLITPLPRPLRILDVGGTQLFWERMGFLGQADVEIVLLNVSLMKVSRPNVRSVIGDARAMPEFEDKEFDIVFSNSVIEHVGDYGQQRQMADEVRRVGKRYFVQTPNRFFPMEPHFLFPFFQFLPLPMRVFLIRHFNLGWYKRITERDKAVAAATEITLLSGRKFRNLFPDAKMHKEKFCGLTKSFIVCGGWD